MISVILGMLAETFVHPGVGRSLGVVDLPVAREAARDYPYIPGSGVKGALRDKARILGKEDDEIKQYFGDNDAGTGKLSCSDAFLLLLPVRSLTGAYKWVTCPYLLERLHRMRLMAGIEIENLKNEELESAISNLKRALQGGGNANQPRIAIASGAGDLFLEERVFRTQTNDATFNKVVENIKPLIFHESTRGRIAGQLVIVNDDDMAWFCRYALPVQARNVLEEKTKKSKNLWYEETIPPDTVMFSVHSGFDKEAVGFLESLFDQNGKPYIQVGGNETVGQGWFAVCFLKATGGGVSQ